MKVSEELLSVSKWGVDKTMKVLSSVTS